MLKDEFFRVISSNELNYYDIDLNDEIAKFDDETIKRTIIRYFETGGKRELVSFKNIQFLPEMRWSHSFSLFLLGNIVGKTKIGQESIIERILSQFNFLPGFNESRFVFYWFLCVLFHDAGYSISQEYRNREINLNWLRVSCHVNHSLYGKSVRIYPFNTSSDYHPLSIRWANHKVSSSPKCRYVDRGIAFPYKFCSIIENNKSVVTDYFDAFRNHDNPSYRELNHGIIGGEMFFSILCDEYARNFKEVHIKDETAKFDRFDYGMLNWQIQLLDVYRIIGDVIISHSMWRIPSYDNVNMYIEKGLDRLPRYGQRLSMRNPLLFLLCFVDTIDPIKYFKKHTDLSTKSILDLVDIHVLGNSIKIRSNEIEYLNYLKDGNLDTWMNVQVSEVIDNMIAIQILE